jgi:tetratricopeptide (TPR) repeat protein
MRSNYLIFGQSARMTRPHFNPQFAIWSTLIAVILTAICAIVYDLGNQRFLPCRAIQQPVSTPDSTKITDALLDTADHQVDLERYLDAWNTLLNAEDTYRKYDRLELLSRVHWMRARMLHELKEFDAAKEEIERSTTLAVRLGSEECKTESEYLLASNLFERHEYEQAYQLIENRLQESRSIPLKNAIHFHNLAGLSREKAGDPYEAETHFLSALRISKRLNPEEYGFIYGNLGHVYAQQGRLQDAAKYLELDFDWSCRNKQYGSAASAAYFLAKILNASAKNEDKETARQHLNRADSLVLYQNTVNINMPADSLWWRIQIAGKHSPDARKDLAIIAKRAALDQKRVEEAQHKVTRDRLHQDGRTQWQKHIADRDRRVQRSGQTISFAAGIFILLAIVFIKSE